MDYRILQGIFSGLPSVDDPRFYLFEDFYQHNKIDVLATLPWLVSELIENDGFDIMLEFVRRYGGCRIYINKDYAAFMQKVGIALSEKTYRNMLLHSASDSVLDIPSAWGIYLKLRNVAIRLLLQSGVNLEQIARDFGMTERALRKIMADG
ncbi:hypothetical protein [Dickeya fangzhongdai]|uniref:hypothetical protein n=1 Tax=Dickeya fangzhongdai TaxID=1778540 RepID=UPI001ADBFF7A|nr:hypothetical protein [Dickeya fangzhongdai]MBO8135344.1 hypothetical protein [Dickeya fangzhongdai]